MSAKLNIIDIVTSAMRAVGHTLGNVCGIVLEEMPSVRRDENIGAIMMPEGVRTTFVSFSQAYGGKNIKGGVVVYIARTSLPILFGSLGITDISSESEIRDVCGEFCNIVTGVFKTEIVRLGYEDVQLSVPESYSDNISDAVNAINANFKYKLVFSHNGRGLLSIDVFME